VWDSGPMARSKPPRTRTISHTLDPVEGCGSSSGSEQDKLPREVRVLGVWELVRVQGTRDHKVSTIAGYQRGRVSRTQVLAAGVSDNMIESMLANGHLIRRLPGVYAAGHAAPTELTHETEALLSSSLPSCLSHISAAILWGLRPADRHGQPVDILIHGETVVRHPGVRSHRTKQLDQKDVRIHRGLPVTSPARTLLDVAPLVSLDELEQMLDDALEHKLVRTSEIRDVLDRCGSGRPGAHRLQQLIDERAGRRSGLARSAWERRLRDLLRRANIAPDDMNVDLYGYIPDMMWREAKLIVEVDGWDPHRQRSRFEADRRKDAILATHGWITLRFTARRIRDEPYAVIAEVALMLGRRMATLANAA
jgi:very-short-patch-repair endonuclease